ncbi:hypothetical protein [Persicobacter psychrovividus]|uniref:Uncharacterized protein n=1 Tax=Persicobacter psychrovividus TaxID=387638 RepID=A0ABN6LBH8_9BACT|nr:hypothetical protein PEPS_28300 [Persicobacter psychrovividus]
MEKTSLTEFIIVEAKGGYSLGSRNGFQQGSKEYFDDLLSTLEKKVGEVL